MIQQQIGFTLQDNRLMTRFQKLRQKNSSLQKQLMIIKTQNVRLTQQNCSINKSYYRSQQTMKQLQNQFQSILSKFEQMQKVMRILQRENKQLKVQLNYDQDKILVNNQQLQSIIQQNKILKQQVASMQETIQLNYNQIYRLQKQYKQNNKCKTLLSFPATPNQKSMINKLQNIQQEALRLRTLYNQSQIQNQRMQGIINSTQKTLLQKQSALSKCKDIIKSMKIDLSHYQKANEKLLDNFQNVQKLLKDITQDCSLYRMAYFSLLQDSKQMLSKIRKQAGLPIQIVDLAKQFCFKVDKGQKKINIRQKCDKSRSRSKSKSRNDSNKKTPDKYSRYQLSQIQRKTQMPFSPMVYNLNQDLQSLRRRQSSLFSMSLSKDCNKEQINRSLRKISKQIAQKQNYR